MSINLTRSGPINGTLGRGVEGLEFAFGTGTVAVSPWINTGICIGDYGGCLEAMAQSNGLRDEVAYPPLAARFESSPLPPSAKSTRPFTRPALAEWLKSPLMKADADALGGVPFD